MDTVKHLPSSTINQWCECWFLIPMKSRVIYIVISTINHRSHQCLATASYFFFGPTWKKQPWNAIEPTESHRAPYVPSVHRVGTSFWSHGLSFPTPMDPAPADRRRFGSWIAQARHVQPATTYSKCMPSVYSTCLCKCMCVLHCSLQGQWFEMQCNYFNELNVMQSKKQFEI